MTLEHTVSDLGPLFLPLRVLELGTFVCEPAVFDLGEHGNADCISEKSPVKMLGKL